MVIQKYVAFIQVIFPSNVFTSNGSGIIETKNIAYQEEELLRCLQPEICAL